MKLTLFVSVLAFAAGLAAGPLGLVPAMAGPPTTSLPEPDAEQGPPNQVFLQGQISSLQTQMQKLQKQVAALEAHKHAFQYYAPPVSRYVSLADLRDAMQAHSPSDGTNWIPLVASNAAPVLGTGNLRSGVTDGPTSAP
jgi:hypothetical protein